MSIPHTTLTRVALSLCRTIWSYWTAKMLVGYILSRVCLRSGQFSQSSFIQYMGLCVFSWPFSLVMVTWISVLDLIIIIKSEVWPICVWCTSSPHHWLTFWPWPLHCMWHSYAADWIVALAINHMKVMQVNYYLSNDNGWVDESQMT